MSNNRIPFYSLSHMHDQIEDNVLNRLREVWRHGRYILGPEVEEFEQAYAAFMQSRHCIGVANGYDAIVIALRAAGLQPGDGVLVPAHTFIATWLAVSAAGGTLIPVDADSGTMNMDPARITSDMWNKARFLLPVHLYGQPADMERLARTAALSDVRIIEDNAQAQGATLHGKPMGSWGLAATTSFYPGKNIGAMGDAGAITTQDEQMAITARKLRNVGGTVRYVHELQGMNSRLDTVQAAILCEKVKHLNEWNDMRRKLAAQYHERLESLEGKGLLHLPRVLEGAEPVWHQYVIRTPERKPLMDYLAAQGIDTLIHYPCPPHLQQAYSSLGYGKGSFPVAEEISETCISLPIFPGLSIEQLERVTMAIGDYFHTQS